MKLVPPCALWLGLLLFSCHGQNGPRVNSAPNPATQTRTVTDAEAAPPGSSIGEGSAGWLSERGRHHPLAGKIWDVTHRTFVPAEQVLLNLRQAGSQLHLLLGEKHDNRDHHRLQAELVHALASSQRGGAVAFEMFDIAQQPALDRYLRASGATAEGLGPALGWERTGWPAWAGYAPIARAAMEGGFSILGANLPQMLVRAVAHEGLAALGESKTAELRLEQAFPAKLEESLQQELETAHCGHLPAEALPRMAAAQHARDAQMAAVFVRAAGPATLIAGAGHVRKDYGVPYFAHQIDPSLSLESIAFVEVDPDVLAAEGYASRFGSSALPFDLVWFTPQANADDPCAGFHK
jgi:uncharacterized iron-regulated protein